MPSDQNTLYSQNLKIWSKMNSGAKCWLLFRNNKLTLLSIPFDVKLNFDAFVEDLSL